MNPLIILMIIIVALMFLFPIIIFFSPKAKSRIMSNMMKTHKQTISNSKNDLESMLSDLGTIQANAQKNILDKNEDTLRYNANKSADINKGAVETTARAIKKGLIEDEDIYCKHCGNKIDADSKFCKKCGKEQ